MDVPDLFPVRNPQLLRWLFVEVARSTGQTSQPNIGTYLHCLTDALLIREFRRYPQARRASARSPSKYTLTDLGVRNAIFRGAHSLWDGPPDVTGPLIETLAQSIIRGSGLAIHFFRDYENPQDRRSPSREVDFVVENLAGEVVPIEVKFRKRVHSEDFAGLRAFMGRFPCHQGLMVTRDLYEWRGAERILCVPLVDFLLAF